MNEAAAPAATNDRARLRRRRVAVVVPLAVAVVVVCAVYVPTQVAAWARRGRVSRAANAAKVVLGRLAAHSYASPDELLGVVTADGLAWEQTAVGCDSAILAGHAGEPFQVVRRFGLDADAIVRHAPAQAFSRAGAAARPGTGAHGAPLVRTNVAVDVAGASWVVEFDVSGD